MKLKAIFVLFVCIILFSGCENNKPKNTENNSAGFITDTAEEAISDNNPYETIDRNDVQTAFWGGTVYFNSVSAINFEQDDLVHVDKLMGYYRVFGMLNWTQEQSSLKPELEQYRTDNLNEYRIPKDIVNNTILKHFSVKLDTSNSEYSDPDDDGFYLIELYPKGGSGVYMNNIRQSGNLVTANYYHVLALSDEIQSKKEICIENPDSEDFCIIYVRDIT